MERQRRGIRGIWQLVGPGFITGASDDDPSGIGTYAVAGASLGYSCLWTALVTYPLMAAVQLICARIGLVSGRGLAGVLRKHYPRPLLYLAVLGLVIANTINISTTSNQPPTLQRRCARSPAAAPRSSSPSALSARGSSPCQS